MMETRERVKSVLAEAMNVDPETIADDCCQDNQHQWDSIVSMMFILGIEDKFGISLALDDAVQFNSLSKVVEMLDDKYLDR